MSLENEEMQPEYSIRGGARGKYFEQYIRSATQELPQVTGPLRLEHSPWIQPQASESRGMHASQSTMQIGAGPIYLTPHLEVGEPAL